MSVTVWLWVHLQVVVVLTCCALRLQFFNRHHSIVGILSIVLISAWPIGQLDLSTQLLPYTGILSLTSMTLLVDTISKSYHWGINLTLMDRCWIEGAAIILGLSLYSAALGFCSNDLYGLGFTGIILPSIVGLMATTAWIYKAKAPALLLLAILWAWLLNLGESQNIWDYILDPWLCICSLWSSGNRLLAYLRCNRFCHDKSVL